MSLFSTMNTAASGLGVSSTSLSVIGDNIANMNTTGFKGNRSEFADFLPNTVYGLAGPSTIGMGAGVDTVATLFGQGSLETSSNSLDLAISGDGFFVVSDGVSDFYSRSGEFYLDDEGFVVNAQGYKLQGYNATEGTLGATVGDLEVDTDPIDPSATTEIELTAILSADEDFSSLPLGSATVDFTSGTGDTLEDVADLADFATSVTVYDSLGTAHEVTVMWERTGTNDWSWYAVVDAGEVDDGATTFVDGAAYQIASGTATFDTDGDLSAFTQTNTSATTAWSFSGATAGDIDFQMGIDTAGVAADGRVRQLAGDSAVSAVSQDGYPPGDLTAISVDSDGLVTGTYSSGEEFILGQVVLASFTSNQELGRAGNTLFRETVGSGNPAIGAPGTGGRGTTQGNALEASNVDLEDEFVSMITSQRTYQANARMINTANDTLQELVNLV